MSTANTGKTGALDFIDAATDQKNWPGRTSTKLIEFPPTTAGHAAAAHWRNTWEDALSACHSVTPGQKILGLALSRRVKPLSPQVSVAASELARILHRSKSDLIKSRTALIEQGWLIVVAQFGNKIILQLSVPAMCLPRPTGRIAPPRAGVDTPTTVEGCRPCQMRNALTGGRPLMPGGTIADNDPGSRFADQLLTRDQLAAMPEPDWTDGLKPDVTDDSNAAARWRDLRCRELAETIPAETGRRGRKAFQSALTAKLHDDGMTVEQAERAMAWAGLA
ncbi:hypothetical protein ABZ342_15260 [Amycolatopsis sp. NPDC005961]|uniref:hypothetical protein n=1 Tax=Amycolatopsis sp. NPDC005961 TaxID=3156720 RepID=UPI0033C07A6E